MHCFPILRVCSPQPRTRPRRMRRISCPVAELEFRLLRRPSSSATATTSLVPHSGSLSGTDTQNGSGSGTPAWALPVYVSLTVVAIASACVAVYWYMKRKSALKDKEYMLQNNRHLPFLHLRQLQSPPSNVKCLIANSCHFQKTVPAIDLDYNDNTTTTKDPENPDTNQTKTTTVTYSAFPHGLPPLGRPPALNAPIEDQPKAVVNTPFLPTDSFLTPNSGYANSPTTSTWTLEEQWQYEQYQAAAYWHQFQLRQKEWQAEQRAYYLLKEEERKKKQLESGTEIELVPRRKLIVGFKPSPLRNVYEIDDESDVSRKNSKASRTSHRVSSILDGIVGTTIGRSSFDAGTAGRPDFMSTRSSFNKSISSRKSNMIVTSPEWSAHPTSSLSAGSTDPAKQHVQEWIH
ncbi:hypothetical protein BCR33DRAFT_109418 [Rhizoclosmatium globosum]|uniref:Uncharacterized protein n=1 Tax=Rhizoclosmatium globosum TaxID=329046 RepID=A0A1Y2CI92_9FUNG|nr:hypothetical protein BCR33DRAFT_109418 [Rhizoclosmatium globosum]|eukprot:ORY46763.1 hypothetical protein BCR33DRAFT_109418 [Rhizoclosmatium globosum]